MFTSRWPARRQHRRRRLVLMLVSIASIVAPAYAHHSFAADYFEDRMIQIEGELVEFEYRAPHAWVHVNAPDENGRMQRFAAEWANPTRLGREGITKDTLRPGDRVIVSGSPSRRDADRKLHLKGIERPADGWRWKGRAGRR